MRDVSTARKDLLKLVESFRQKADRLTREAKSLEAAATALVEGASEQA